MTVTNYDLEDWADENMTATNYDIEDPGQLKIWQLQIMTLRTGHLVI